jgi:MoaA/NifB/PqqE/SkfB family radical SAM enzyme
MSLSVMWKLLHVFVRMRRGLPTFVSFNSLNSCNQACPMCAVWRQGGERLSVAEIEPIFRDLKNFGFLVVGISGGEPFLREDLFEIFSLLDRIGFFYTTTTNGTLLTEEAIDRIRSARQLLQLAVSLDSLQPSVYGQLRGRPLLPVVLNNLERLAQAELPFPVKINMTMNRLNYRETYDLLEYAKARNLYLSVFPVNQGAGFLHRHHTSQFNTTESEGREMADIFRDLARLRRLGEPLWEYSGFYDQAADYVTGRPMGRCDAGRLYIDIGADGWVGACIDRERLACLRTTSVEEAMRLVNTQDQRILACSEETPCCYTCTCNISLTSANLAAFFRETVRVRVRRLRRSRT